MWKKVLVVILAVVAIFLVFVATRPNTFRVERSITTKASPEKVFALIEDFHNWQLWSPYEKMDADMKKTYSGIKTGKGAVYEWESKKAGVGKMEIMEINPGANVLIKLDFSKPMTAHNTAEFIIEKQNEQTKVTWAMYGPVSFPAKAIHIFFDMDKMVGKDFESGLLELAKEAEKKEVKKHHAGNEPVR